MQATTSYSPGLEGVIAGETQIAVVNSEIDSLTYRGYDVRDLAEHGCFEEVAYLLLKGHLPTPDHFKGIQEKMASQRNVPDELIALLQSMPKGTDYMDVLRTSVSMLSHFDPDVEDDSEAANIEKAFRLTAKIPTIITAAHRIFQGQTPIAPDASLSYAENFFYMLNGEKPDATTAKCFDTTLILYAEHGFNASTFCGRVTTSTLSDLHSGITSAIGTLKGPLHGGANEEAMKMLQEIGSVDNAEKWVLDALTQKKKIMGFGHRVYKNGDTRAPILKTMARKLCEEKGNTQWPDMADIVEATMMREKGIYPNVDFPASYLYYVLGLPIPLYTPIFAASRVTGWSAHIIEQLGNNRLIRPKAEYVGPAHKAYVPVAQR